MNLKMSHFTDLIWGWNGIQYPVHGELMDLSKSMEKNLANVEYKFNEGELIKEIREYVNSTYNAHYAQNNYQATEEIVDDGDGYAWCRGNMLKYTKRLRRKGTPEDWRKDIMKVIHYAIVLLDVHDREYSPKKPDVSKLNMFSSPASTVNKLPPREMLVE